MRHLLILRLQVSQSKWFIYIVIVVIAEGNVDQHELWTGYFWDFVNASPSPAGKSLFSIPYLSIQYSLSLLEIYILTQHKHPNIIKCGVFFFFFLFLEITSLH